MGISMLSNQEYVTLIGHYNQVGDKTLESQLRSRNYTPEAIAKIKSKLDNQPAQLVRSLNVQFKTTKSFTFDGFGYYSNLYFMYSDNGVLPFEGCLADQPSKIIEIFEVFDQLKIESENAKIKELQKNGK